MFAEMFLLHHRTAYELDDLRMTWTTPLPKGAVINQIVQLVASFSSHLNSDLGVRRTMHARDECLRAV